MKLLIKFLGLLFLIISIVFISIPFFLWFKSPELTYMQIFMSNAGYWFLGLIFGIAGMIIRDYE